MAKRILYILVAAVVCASVGVTALVVAAPAEKANTVKVCVGKRGTVVSAKANGRCPAGSTLTTINKTGPVGPAGPSGPSGAPGEVVTVTPTDTPTATATVTVTESPTSTDGPSVIDGGAP